MFHRLLCVTCLCVPAGGDAGDEGPESVPGEGID